MTALDPELVAGALVLGLSAFLIIWRGILGLPVSGAIVDLIAGSKCCEDEDEAPERPGKAG